MTPKTAFFLVLTLVVGLLAIVLTAFALTKLGVDKALLAQLLAGLPVALAAVGSVIVSLHNGAAISASRSVIDATQTQVAAVHARLARTPVPAPAPPAPGEVSDGR